MAEKKYTHLIIFTYLCMIAFGFTENIKGTAIPPIRAQFSINYSSVGIMLFVSTLGYITATFIGGFAADRFGQKKVLSLGFILVIIACTAFPFSKSFLVVSLLYFLLNAGFGCFDVSLNSLGAKIFTRNSAIMMNLMHLFYGLGSSAGPKYAGWLLSKNVSWGSVYFYSLLFTSAVFLFMCFSRFPEDNHDGQDGRIPFIDIVKNKKIWLFAGLLGFCEAAELGVANWLVNFLQQIRSMNVSDSSSYLTLFFITFTAGRLVGGFLAEKLGYVKIIIYFTIAAMAVFAGGLLLGSNFAYLFSLVGFFVSIMFPTIIVIIMKEFKSGTSSVIGFIITGAAGVNMIVNFLIGKTNDIAGVGLGFASVLIYDAAILAIIFPLSRLLIFSKPEQMHS